MRRRQRITKTTTHVEVARARSVTRHDPIARSDVRDDHATKSRNNRRESSNELSMGSFDVEEDSSIEEAGSRCAGGESRKNRDHELDGNREDL